MAFIFVTLGLTTLSHSALADFQVTAAQNPFTPLFGLKTDFDQVRIDQRVVIRLPSQPAPPAAVGAKRQSLAKVEYKEKKIGKCLRLDRLGGSRPGPDRTLELLTRDGVLIRAYLSEGCLAREFYAGAYMERSYDGKLCVDRDMLHARTGAKCQIDKFRLLIPR